MEIAVQDWASMLVRWLHITTGIAWIGSSFYFIWLDLSLRQRDGMPEGANGEVWSVHGGGFYHAQKYLVAPKQMPDELHWFKYESYFTWLSGFCLLAIMYYWGAESFLIDTDKMALEAWQAIVGSLAFLAGGWVGQKYNGAGNAGLCSGRRLFLWPDAGLQRPRSDASCRRNDRHNDDRQRFFYHHPQSEDCC